LLLFGLLNHFYPSISFFFFFFFEYGKILLIWQKAQEVQHLPNRTWKKFRKKTEANKKGKEKTAAD
jgi:hypothetical protein